METQADAGIADPRREVDQFERRYLAHPGNEQGQAGMALAMRADT
jgi:hypothetical protein